MTRACIGLGSNLQDPAAQLQAAVDALARLPDSTLTAGSALYRSAAVGPGIQPDYLNAVAVLETALTPEALLDALQAIEQARGRRRTLRWGPRTLDLDILLYGDRQIRLPRLQVPHPAMARRHFVLYPLADVCDPRQPLPCGRTLEQLLAECPRQELERSDAELDYHLQHGQEPGP
ncbi:2-amino-4-hydroxy-6-hydroxymethyldihydropteridine diphosphokinase [Kineobactrum salinum]|uniref:2-amino-4-hydroxy-6-hydroxymethyldihydropteridine pyrophosphokinase n=1 Tax=Kineobactrum salinum TaxID=2708301 RepID=A0A6C0TYG3_9GAMM|nr:2-amino-4-hydroxy-6-hydroxymethyldihydropteridine diphosphokinase [Kineobactrum salinum]QIB64870.1 2-amino-4-hydroxy-6-hydroxymethyldihydropteridine diphosphokinase [Kineobactrum salinum]